MSKTSAVKLFNHPYILYDRYEEGEWANPAIGICIDNGGTVVLSQEGREIVFSLETIEDLRSALATLRHDFQLAQGKKLKRGA